MSMNNGFNYTFENCITIDLGTIPGKIRVQVHKRMAKAGFTDLDLERLPKIHFDYSEPGNDGQVSLPPGSTIWAVYNQARVEELAAAHELWDIPCEMRHGDSVSGINLGAANNQRRGALAFKIQEGAFKERLKACMKSLVGYGAQRQLASEGAKGSQKGGAITVKVNVSGPGGMGGGSLRPCLKLIRRLETDLRVVVKIEVCVLVLGTAETHNLQQARKNENELLKFLVAARYGLPRNPLTADGSVAGKPLFDTLYLVSNSNDHGEITDWNAFQSMLSQLDFYRLCTPAGETLREASIDIETSHDPDWLGITACASTLGFSVIHLDRDRICAYAGLQVVENLLDNLTTATDAAQVRENTGQLLKSLDLEESEDVSAASGVVLHPEGLQGMDASEQAVTGVVNGIQGLRGLKRYDALNEQKDFMERQFVPTNLEPMMEERADRLKKKAWTGMEQALEGYDRSVSGPAHRVVAVGEMNRLLEQDRNQNNRKLNELIQLQQFHHDRIATTGEWVGRYRRKWWLWRVLLYLWFLRRLKELVEDGTRAVACGVEIAARKTLEERVYGPLLDLVGAKGAEAAEVVSKLNQAKNHCKAQADALLAQPATETAPVGIELVDAKYLRTARERVLGECGGTADLTQRLFAHYRERHPSTTALVDMSVEDLLEGLQKAAEGFCAGAVQQFNVIDAFNEKHPTVDRRRAAVLLCDEESQGRMCQAKGERGAEPKWVKVLGVESEAAAESLKQILRQHRSTPGDWKVAVTGDRECICFVQQRSGLSLATEYRGHGANGVSVRELAQQGPDPVTALQPGLNPTKRNAEVALLQAWAMGRVSSDNGGGIDLLVGKDDVVHFDNGKAAIVHLKKYYLRMVEIHWDFACRIAHEHDRLLAELKRFGDTSQNGVSPELRAVISPWAVDWVVEMVKELHRQFLAPEEE